MATVENIIIPKQINSPYPDDVSQEKAMISVGFKLIKLVKKMDVALAPMITNTYLICMLSATGFLYISSTALFYRGKIEVVLLSIAALSVAWSSVFRLYTETKQGHNLAKLMKKCSHHLDRYPFIEENMNLKEIQLLREEFRYHCESPIAPYSAFTLSTSSLLGQFGSIVTYIIVLLQFRSA